ncbi:outer membrane lipoprotein-sorting protein [Fusibacter sp. 3D3]|nr:outer membrane lipoprotein-sorting protein [Fusibacter sp. 3D3]
MSVEAFRVKIFNMVTDVTEKYTAIRFKENDTSDALSRIEQWHSYYYPDYIPEGYALVEAKGSGALKIMYFSNGSNDRIEFSQASIDANLQVDTEDASIEDIEINGMAGIFVEKEDLSILLWATDTDAFYILGTLDKETFLNIAENLELK